MKQLKKWAAPAASLIASITLAAWAVAIGKSNWIDASVLISGVVWVWLSARASLWNFPVGLVNASVAAVSLFQQKIYADATLYGLYFVLMAFGWWQWKQGKQQDVRPILDIPRNEFLALLFVAVALWGLAFVALDRIGGYSPLFDGLGFAASLAAQYLLSRKYLQNWIGWVLVNMVYVSLYFLRGNIMFFLYALILLAMSFVGLWSWRDLKAAQADGS